MILRITTSFVADGVFFGKIIAGLWTGSDTVRWDLATCIPCDHLRFRMSCDQARSDWPMRGPPG
jgi:hypothetical protein